MQNTHTQEKKTSYPTRLALWKQPYFSFCFLSQSFFGLPHLIVLNFLPFTAAHYLVKSRLWKKQVATPKIIKPAPLKKSEFSPLNLHKNHYRPARILCTSYLSRFIFNQEKYKLCSARSTRYFSTDKNLTTLQAVKKGRPALSQKELDLRESQKRAQQLEKKNKREAKTLAESAGLEARKAYKKQRKELRFKTSRGWAALRRPGREADLKARLISERYHHGQRRADLKKPGYESEFKAYKDQNRRLRKIRRAKLKAPGSEKVREALLKKNREERAKYKTRLEDTGQYVWLKVLSDKQQLSNEKWQAKRKLPEQKENLEKYRERQRQNRLKRRTALDLPGNEKRREAAEKKRLLTNQKRKDKRKAKKEDLAAEKSLK